MRTLIGLVVFLVLAGCSNTGAMKVGPDTYMISTRVAFGGPASAKGEALRDASIYCSSLQREILVNRIQASECALRGGCGEAEVFFYCLPAGDPQLARPKYVPDPDLKIEINNR
ncbi:hypothetical protein LOY37_13960 [Pseudomonas sp. B21-012]|uniref:hypothetical protein n=1 Tax=Pseudomonas sp. B21-012 TaxID=2895472 RepID=UPI00215F2A3D|nr:hypothetical protein [Pseudomonas sp. B21-012]UVM53483.1 hypothetical protein LOY37_13960 [Pseudomonas sp. B21-012]